MTAEIDPLNAYLVLRHSRPELFRNFDSGTYEILFEPARISEAQAEARNSRARQGQSINDLRVGVLADDPYLTLLREAVRFPDGTLGLYNRVLAPVGATILPMLDNHVVLLHRFRHGTRAWHLELPRGIVTGGGSVEDGARRELREEIGASAIHLEALGIMHSSTGCLDEIEHLFLAQIDRTSQPDRHEAIKELCVIDVAEFENRIREGEITDAPTLAAFLRARLRGLL